MGEIVRFNTKSVVTGTTAGQVLVQVDNSAATDFSSAGPSGANMVQIRFEVHASTTTTVIARYNCDGSTPTASVGVPIANLDVITFATDEIKNLSIIGVDANSQDCWCTWYTV